MFKKAIKFLREVIVELKKVSWSSRKETFSATVIVIILIMIIAVFIGAVDFVLSKVIGTLLR